MQGLMKVVHIENMVASVAGDLIRYTMRTHLLNWCNLVSISKNVVF